MAKTEDKILYRSGKFYALRLPDRPIYPSANQDTERAWRRYESDLKYYNQQVESLKANPPEIVNANDLIKEFDFIDGEAKINPSFKDGDTFPLPSNMRFEEDTVCPTDRKQCHITCNHCSLTPIKVVRIVKADTKEPKEPCVEKCTGPWDCQCEDVLKAYNAQLEPEESQFDLWTEIVETIRCTEHKELIHLMKQFEGQFIIQRKKQ